MVRSLLILCVVLSAAFLSASCGKDKTQDYALRYTYDYFPLKTGKYITYKVDSITYDIGADEQHIARDTFHFFIKEVIADTITDGNGKGWRVMRYFRNSDTATWNIRNVWVAKLLLNRAERVESNNRFVKLVFPIDTISSWNPAIYNDQNAEIVIGTEVLSQGFSNYRAKYKNIDRRATVGTKTFDSTLTVQMNEDTKDQFYLYREIYARGIGLVSKEWRIVDTQNFGAGYILTRAEKGFFVRYTVVDYN